MKKKIVCTQVPAPSAAYSQAIEAGGMVFVSGQRPADPKTGAISDDLKQQVRQVLENIAGVLKEAELSMDDVVRTTVYLDDIAYFADMNEVYTEFFNEPFPARTTVGVQLRGIKAEIDAIAVKPRGCRVGENGINNSGRYANDNT